MNDKPLMPKATAVWLVENTKISFKQIADFCNLHELEVKGIADGDVAKGIKAYNPILAGQLTRDEIETFIGDTDALPEFAAPGKFVRRAGRASACGAR